MTSLEATTTTTATTPLRLDVSRCAWTSARLPIELESHTAHRAVSSLGLGVRRNPRRAHLVVSPALAKHVAIKAHVAVEAASSLADKACEQLGAPDVIIGFAETATGLARLVADRTACHFPDVFYTHSTRTESGPAGWYFNEPHSHAATHRVALSDPSRLASADVIWLVDDEVTSGNTTANVIRELKARTRARSVHVVCLVDARHERDTGPLVDVAAETGLNVSMVSLAEVTVAVAPSALEAAAELVDRTPSNIVTADSPPCHELSSVLTVEVDAPAEIDRHGITLPHDGLQTLGAAIQRQVVDVLTASCGSGDVEVPASGSVARPGVGELHATDSGPSGTSSDSSDSTCVTNNGLSRAQEHHFAQFQTPNNTDTLQGCAPTSVHVVGVEEQIPAAVRCAEAFTRTGWSATVSTSTRSPALAIDDPGYPLRSVITWPGHDAPRFAYNIPPADVIVIIPDFGSHVADAHVQAFRSALPTSQVVVVKWR